MEKPKLPQNDELEKLEKKIESLKGRISEPEQKEPDNSASLGYKMLMELVSGVAVGGFIGFWLDKWLSTTPLFLLLFLLLGMAAGVRGMMRG